MPRLTLIVAATLTNGIGKNGTLPWRLPKEMSYFARTTMNAPEGSINAVIMGRNTWESIPEKFRPLKNRTNLVISRNGSYELTPAPKSGKTTAHLFSSLSAALLHLEETQGNDHRPIHRAFVIGGASLYQETLLLPPPSAESSTSSNFVDRVLLTRILQPAFEDCDTVMPDFMKIAEEQSNGALPWRQASHDELEEWVGGAVPRGEVENGVHYEFQMWVR